MALGREDRGDLIVIHSGARESESLVAHFRSARELCYRTDPPPDLEIGYCPAAPDDPDRGDLVLAAVKHDFVEETSQRRFALSSGCSWVGPDLRQAACKADNVALQRLVHSDLCDRLGTGVLEGFFGRPNFVQRRFPATLEFGGDETIVGVHSIELAFGQSGGIPLSFEFALGAGAQRGLHLVLGEAGL